MHYSIERSDDMDKKKRIDDWIATVALAVQYTLHTDITHLLECGPGRVALNDTAFSIGRVPLGDRADLRHIVDWIVASIERGEEWLTRLDDKGRPLKLMKCGTLERLTYEADKAMRRWNSQTVVSDHEAGTKVVFEFSDGYRLLKLTTSAALDAESTMMGHCVGNGAYDQVVADGHTEILSLRDTAGRSHVTIELRTDRNRIEQIMGKANTSPKPEYIKRLIEWFNENPKMILNDVELPPFHPSDQSGRIVDLASLKPGAVFEGDLVLRCFDDKEVFCPPLPQGLVVRGDLIVQAHRRDRVSARWEDPVWYHHPVEKRGWDDEDEVLGPRLQMPEGVKVEGSFTVVGLRSEIAVEAWRYRFVACYVEKLPQYVDRSLEMFGCRFASPIRDVRFGRNLRLEGCGTVEFAGLTEIGGELIVEKSRQILADHMSASFDGECRVGGNLYLEDAEFEVAGNLRVGGSLEMFMTALSVGGDMRIDTDLSSRESVVCRMPTSLVIGGDMTVSATDVDHWPDVLVVGGETDMGLGNNVLDGSSMRPRPPKL